VEQQLLGQNLTHSPIHARSGLIFFLWVSVWMEETYLYKTSVEKQQEEFGTSFGPHPYCVICARQQQQRWW
jgi:hypothetical protein